LIGHGGCALSAGCGTGPVHSGPQCRISKRRLMESSL
jgi:hypothetical protein